MYQYIHEGIFMYRTCSRKSITRSCLLFLSTHSLGFVRGVQLFTVFMMCPCISGTPERVWVRVRVASAESSSPPSTTSRSSTRHTRANCPSSSSEPSPSSAASALCRFPKRDSALYRRRSKTWRTTRSFVASCSSTSRRSSTASNTPTSTRAPK